MRIVGNQSEFICFLLYPVELIYHHHTFCFTTQRIQLYPPLSNRVIY